MIDEGGFMRAREILQMLPHRYPVLLVDRVERCVPGESIAGFKNVTDGEFGACGQARSMPRALILEALAQISVILTFRTLGITPTGRELMFFAGIDSAEFGRPACRGDKLDLQSSVVRVMPGKGIGKFRTRATIAGEVVAIADMLAAIRMS